MRWGGQGSFSEEMRFQERLKEEREKENHKNI